MIQRDTFKTAINSLRVQIDYDDKYCRDLQKALKVEDVNMYNNEELVKCIVDMLTSNFKDKEEAEALIHNFMYEYDFGRHSDPGVLSLDELWESLAPDRKGQDADTEESEQSSTDLDHIFRNVHGVIGLYHKSIKEKGSKSERLNIVNALRINIDFLKDLTENEDKDDLAYETTNYEDLNRALKTLDNE